MEAIGLNPIRLDAIGIDPIRLNAIRLGVPGASSGSSGRPYIDPEVLASLVAVCICDGKSNNDPDRAVIKNLVDPANPFVISNAAYKLNSGFGKYEISFKEGYRYNNSVVKDITDESFNFDTEILIALLYKNIKVGESNDEPSYKIKVSNLSGKLRYYYINDKGSRVYIEFTSNGEYTLPISYDSLAIENTWIGFSSYSASSGTITQIPSFQGAFYADGVNDMITSTKTMSEMLGGGNKCTVISFITHISGAGKYNFIGNSRIQVSGYAGQSFMAGCSSKSGEKIVELGDKEKIQAFQYTTFDSKLSIGSLETGIEISSYAYYGTFVFNKDSVPIDWIHQVIAYFYLDKYVTADIIYDTIRQGITNENHASFNDELVDFSGNGHNLKIYNSAWNKESGINDEGAWQTDGVSDYGQFVGDLGLKDYTVAVDRAYPSFKVNAVPVISDTLSNSGTTPFLFEFQAGDKVVRPFSFGSTTILTTSLELNRKISYQSTYVYNNTVINKGKVNGISRGLTIGRFGANIQYANIALWSLLLFPYSLSEFLLERQLKRYKLGTLHPDMVEVRPIINSTGKYFRIEYRNGQGGLIQPGSYLPVSSILRISVVLNNNWDEVSSLKVDSVDIPKSSYSNNNFWIYDATVTKSPQKIDITIDEYIRYEDIVQPYPFIFPIVDTNNKVYSWGDKIKVGTEIKFAYGSNLLPQLYELRGEVMFNGNAFDEDSKHIIGKTNIFTLTEAPKYLKDNEPNCILAPQILRIPNASYKILGYIPDLTGKGNHGKINNSAYAGMSGANGYKYDWSNWIKYADGKLSDNSFVMNTSATMATTKLFSPQSYAIGDKSYSFRFKISGLINNQRIEIDYPKDSDGNAITSDYLSNGEYYTKDYTTGEVQRLNFFLINANIGEPVNIKIEQIGEYEGSFCLDGVEDFLTIPTLSHGAKQILIKVNWQTDNTLAYDQRVTSGYPYYFAIYTSNEGSTIAYNPRNTNGKTYIDGVLNSAIFASQLKGITHNITITNNDVTEDRTTSPVIGSGVYHNGFFTKMTLFAFMSFPEISSEDEIKELNDIVGIEGNTDDLFNEPNI